MPLSLPKAASIQYGVQTPIHSAAGSAARRKGSSGGKGGGSGSGMGEAGEELEGVQVVQVDCVVDDGDAVDLHTTEVMEGPAVDGGGLGATEAEQRRALEVVDTSRDAEIARQLSIEGEIGGYGGGGGGGRRRGKAPARMRDDAHVAARGAPPRSQGASSGVGAMSRREVAYGSLASCRRCRIPCYEWEQQLRLCPDCAVEHVMEESGHQATASAYAASSAITSSAARGGGGGGGGGGGAPRKRNKPSTSTPAPKRPRPSMPSTAGGDDGYTYDGDAAFATAGGGGWPAGVDATDIGVEAGQLTFAQLESVGAVSAAMAQAEEVDFGPGTMWVDGFAAELLQQLRCSVCLGYLDRCVTSPCVHRFCQGCIEKWLRVGRHDCPECKLPVKTRRSFMRDLRVDGIVSQLLTDYAVDPSGMTAEQVEEAGIVEVDGIWLSEVSNVRGPAARAAAPYADINVGAPKRGRDMPAAPSSASGDGSDGDEWGATAEYNRRYGARYGYRYGSGMRGRNAPPSSSRRQPQVPARYAQPKPRQPPRAPPARASQAPPQQPQPPRVTGRVPEVGDVVEVEVECEGQLGWRRAQVRQTPGAARFVVCVAFASGEWDELFVEEYATDEEGTEWRWPALGDALMAALAPPQLPLQQSSASASAAGGSSGGGISGVGIGGGGAAGGGGGVRAKLQALRAADGDAEVDGVAGSDDDDDDDVRVEAYVDGGGDDDEGGEEDEYDEDEGEYDEYEGEGEWEMEGPMMEGDDDDYVGPRDGGGGGGRRVLMVNHPHVGRLPSAGGRVYVRRPCGRGPSGMEWDTSIGDWVPAGRSKAPKWVPRRQGGPRKRGANELLGGKRGGQVLVKHRRDKKGRPRYF